jgi:hypothetical protein
MNDSKVYILSIRSFKSIINCYAIVFTTDYGLDTGGDFGNVLGC